MTAGMRLPSELSGMVPRDVRLTASGMAAAGVAGCLATAALVSAILMSTAYLRAQDERDLRARDAVQTRAEVVQVGMTRGEHPRRVVTYAYEVDGRRYTGRSTFGQRERSVEADSQLEIAFLASHPETSWRIGEEPDGIPLAVIPVLLIVLLGAATAIVWGLRRQWMLLAEGRAARARVASQKKVRRDKRTAYRIVYEFQTLSGATHTGAYDASRTPPAVGTMIPIVYHRENPRWSAPYPLALVRPSRTGAID